MTLPLLYLLEKVAESKACLCGQMSYLADSGEIELAGFIEQGEEDLLSGDGIGKGSVLYRAGDAQSSGYRAQSILRELREHDLDQIQGIINRARYLDALLS